MRTKIDVGQTLSEVFALYRAHAGVLLPTAFWLFLAVAVIEGIFADSAGGLMVTLIFALVVGILYQGVVVNLVRRVEEGSEAPTMGSLLEQAMPFLPRLLAVGVLSGIAMGIGLLLLLVPGLYLLTIWAVLAPVIVVEDSGVSGSFGRSRGLVRGNGWPVFGAVLTAFLIAAAGSLVLGAIATEIAGGPLLEIVFGAIAATVTAPIAALVAAVLYFRLVEIERAAVAPPPPPPVEPPSVVE